MLTILLLLVWRTVATLHGYVKACAPSNIAVAYLRGPRGLKWVIPSAVVAVPTYLCAAWLVVGLVDRGATEWLYVAVLVAYLDACKFAALALVVPLRWARAAVAGPADRRRASI
ncbi:hypothetical protein ACFVJS_00925 [Nocardioides sp. NPDC057772]|uniref:hypothetical protein n=1 Tax=Nocardioides sp. NPDC057772 TaxID=3346245 RepID=UPI003673639E